MNILIIHWLFLLSLLQNLTMVTLSDLTKDIQQVESRGNSLIRSRKRRYVVFPEGSTLTVAACVSPTALSGTGAIFTSGVAWALSYDLPNETIHSKSEIDDLPVMIKRHKRDLFVRVEKLMDSAGMNGKSCMLKTVCETAQNLKPRQNVFEEILRFLFTYPLEKKKNAGSKAEKHYVKAHHAGETNRNCADLFPCPISLLELGLGFLRYPQTVL